MKAAAVSSTEKTKSHPLPDLKEQYHEDFAVLGQFCTKITTLRPTSSSKCFCKAMTKISNGFYHRGLTIINFEDFWNTQHQNSIKLANFFKFQSISIHAIRSDRRQETVSVPSNGL